MRKVHYFNIEPISGACVQVEAGDMNDTGKEIKGGAATVAFHRRCVVICLSAFPADPGIEVLKQERIGNIQFVATGNLS